MSIDNIPPDKREKLIARLEAGKARLIATMKPSAPEVPAVARSFADPASNPIINRPAPRPAKPKPRKTAKAPEARLTPTPFYVFTTAKAIGDDPGSISESYYVTEGKLLALCDAAGVPGEWHPISERGPLRTAQQLLKQRLGARRGQGPNHGRISYPKTGWV